MALRFKESLVPPDSDAIAMQSDWDASARTYSGVRVMSYLINAELNVDKNSSLANGLRWIAISEERIVW